MWMSTYDNGLAATLYGPCKVSALVADKVPVEITCRTDYPFKETIEVTVKPAHQSRFPISFRSPGWCNNPALTINDSTVRISAVKNGFFRVERLWKAADVIHLNFPMTVQVNTGYDIGLKPNQKPEVLDVQVRDSTKTARPYATVSYGPLLFALPIPELSDSNTPDLLVKWKYALESQGKNPGSDITVERGPMPEKWDWPFDSPLKLFVNAVSFDWNTSDYVLPGSPVIPPAGVNSEKIILIPYGCTKFRISMMPVTERTFKLASKGKK
jgi:hypothetical protein